MKEFSKRKNGISLIVLVITIIIMIIIAAAIILSLSSSGIIGQARNATSDSDLANAKQVVAVAKGEYELGEVEGYSNFKAYAEAKLEEAGYKVGAGKNSYIVTKDGKVVGSGTNNTMYIGSDGKYAVIPEGFIASKITTEDTVTEGLVIYEGTAEVTDADSDSNGIIDAQETRNQFVWIPVDNIVEFKTEDGYELGELQTFVSGGKAIEPCTFLSTLSAINDTTGEFAEYDAMKKSVAKYGGFYIARYEAGTTVQREYKANGTTDVLIQKNKHLYEYVAWGPSMTETEGDCIGTYNGAGGADALNQGKGAVQLSRELYNLDSVKSTLTYGVQWDAALRFISSNPEHVGYFQDAEEKGNYTQGALPTGSSEVYAVNNIYDMAGNAWEWTMEAYKDGVSTSRILRGAEYYSDSTIPASNRCDWGRDDSLTAETIGFRPSLYIV